MSTTAAITTEQVEKASAWLQAFYTADETMNARHWITGFFYPDAAITFNDEPPAKGHEAMISKMQSFNNTLSSIKHIVERLDALSDRLYIQLQVEIVVKNDPEQKAITYGGMVVAHKKINEDRVSFYKIYTNKTPLEQRIKMFN
jgi:hypothetical protein